MLVDSTNSCSYSQLCRLHAADRSICPLFSVSHGISHLYPAASHLFARKVKDEAMYKFNEGAITIAKPIDNKPSH